MDEFIEYRGKKIRVNQLKNEFKKLKVIDKAKHVEDYCYWIGDYIMPTGESCQISVNAKELYTFIKDTIDRYGENCVIGLFDNLYYDDERHNDETVTISSFLLRNETEEESIDRIANEKKFIDANIAAKEMVDKHIVEQAIETLAKFGYTVTKD